TFPGNLNPVPPIEPTELEFSVLVRLPGALRDPFFRHKVRVDIRRGRRRPVPPPQVGFSYVPGMSPIELLGVLNRLFPRPHLRFPHSPSRYTHYRWMGKTDAIEPAQVLGILLFIGRLHPKLRDLDGDFQDRQLLKNFPSVLVRRRAINEHVSLVADRSHPHPRLL